jgi:hypothetical protein
LSALARPGGLHFREGLEELTSITSFETLFLVWCIINNKNISALTYYNMPTHTLTISSINNAFILVINVHQGQ